MYIYVALSCLFRDVGNKWSTQGWQMLADVQNRSRGCSWQKLAKTGEGWQVLAEACRGGQVDRSTIPYIAL